MVTAEQYLNMPEAGRCELVQGTVRPLISPGARHGQIAMRMGRWIANHVEEHGLGTVYAAETGFLLSRDPDTVRAPDVAFVAAARPGCPERGYCEGAPDLVVEVLSPSDRPGYMRDKVAEWLTSGAQAVWVVDPRRRVAIVHAPALEPVTLGVGDTLVGGPLLPGLAIAVEHVFRP